MNIFFDFNFMCEFHLFHNLKNLPIRCNARETTGKKFTNHPMCISGPLVHVHSWRKHLPISALFHWNLYFLYFIHKCSVLFYGGLHHPQVFSSLLRRATSPTSVQFSSSEGYITHKCPVLFYGGLHHPQVSSSLLRKASASPTSVQSSLKEGYITYKCSVLFYGGLHHPQVFSSLLRRATSPTSVQFSFTEGYITHKCPALYYGRPLHHQQVFSSLRRRATSPTSVQFSFTEGYITHKCSVLFYGGLHHPKVSSSLLRKASASPTSVQSSSTEGYCTSPTSIQSSLRGATVHHPQLFRPLYYRGPLYHQQVLSPRLRRVLYITHKCSVLFTEGYITHKCSALYYGGTLIHQQVFSPLLRRPTSSRSVQPSTIGRPLRYRPNLQLRVCPGMTWSLLNPTLPGQGQKKTSFALTASYSKKS